MALDFSKIDKTVDLKGLQADVEEAKKNGGGDFPTIPAGKYEVRVETLEVKGTKSDGRPLWDRPKEDDPAPKMDVNPPRRTRKKREPHEN